MNSTSAKSQPPSLRRRLVRLLLPSSIVGRTTLTIVLLSTFVGMLVAVLGGSMIQRSEQARTRAQLGELLATVESTVSIACFVKDQSLAREINSGLMSNELVSGVRIVAGTSVLNQQSRPGAAAEDSEHTLAISRKVYSPFKQSENVGEIWLYADQAAIRSQAWGYTRFVAEVLAVEAALVTLGVAWMVFSLVTRPIKGISDELHRLEVRTGVRLRIPRGNRQNEIGRLVSDVNHLIAELTTRLDTEHRLHMEREVSERRLALIIEKVDAGIFEVDKEGQLLSWNPAFVRTLGAPPEPPSLMAMMNGQAQRLGELILASLGKRMPCEADFELSLDRQKGAAQWVELSLTPVTDRILQGVVNDISERKHAELAAQRLAQQDPLTGQLNRRGLELGLIEAFERRRSEPEFGIAVLQVDLDYFKQVNDTYGHEAGDIVLRHVASVLGSAVRHTDLVARPGGDEFTLVLLDVESATKPQNIAQQIIHALNIPIDLGNGAQAHIGASIGVALVQAADDSPASVLQRADAAMYSAKQAGRNRAFLAPPSVTYGLGGSDGNSG